ncbi:hypothetical protein IAU60_001547 [Kwoniella sp. DSM 27419]
MLRDHSTSVPSSPGPSSPSPSFVPSSPSSTSARKVSRNPVPLRLAFTSSSRIWRSQGQKRARSDDDESDDYRGVNSGPRPFVKLKLGSSRQHSTLSGQSKSEPEDVTWVPDTVKVPRESNDITPPSRRPRSSSNASSSSIVGLLVSEDESLSSPIESNAPVMTSSASALTVTNTTASVKVNHYPYTPSPLASIPINGSPLVQPPAFQASRPVAPVSEHPVAVDGTPVTVIAKARAKFLMEVEALGTELNAVFKLGYGRGLGKGLSNGRGPSKLSSPGASTRTQPDESEEVEMELDN